MIITKILGGLGNQMFQYAAGRSLSERLGVELKLDVSGFEGHELREYCLNVFNIKEVFATKEELEEIAMTNVKHHILSRLFPNLSKYSTSYFKEKPLFKFNRHFLSLTDNTVLEKYWKSVV